MSHRTKSCHRRSVPNRSASATGLSASAVQETAVHSAWEDRWRRGGGGPRTEGGGQRTEDGGRRTVRRTVRYSLLLVLAETSRRSDHATKHTANRLHRFLKGSVLIFCNVFAGQGSVQPMLCLSLFALRAVGSTSRKPSESESLLTKWA